MAAIRTPLLNKVTKMKGRRHRLADAIQAVKGRMRQMRWPRNWEWEMSEGVLMETVMVIREEWAGLVPRMYNEVLGDLDPEEVWEIVIRQGMAKGPFMDWLDQKAWEKAEEEQDD